LLRHEAGHAFNYAYRIHARKGWKETFGDINAPDGVSFEQKSREPGRFQLGFAATKTSPPKLQVYVTAPKR
jgi:hypothetical protein